MATSLAMRMMAGFFGVSLSRRLKELYLFSLLFSFAQGLILIFEPIFLYQQGFSLSFIAMFYALHYTAYVFLLPLGSMFASQFGVERALAVSTPIFMMYVLTLAALPWKHELWIIAIIVLTIYKIFYWPAWHADFATFGDKHNRGTEISWMNLLLHGVGVISPFLGGLVALLYGFPVLFITAAITVLGASVALLWTKDTERSGTFTYATAWRIITNPKHWRMVVAMAGMGENLVQLVFWPVFMFIIVGNTAQLGLVATIAGIVMTLYGFVVGACTDRWPNRTVLRAHVPFMVLANIFFPLAATPGRVMLANIFSNISYIGVNIPMMARLYGEAVKRNPLAYTTAFEIVLAIAKAITAWLLVLVFIFFLPYTAFSLTFLLAGLLVLFYLFL